MSLGHHCRCKKWKERKVAGREEKEKEDLWRVAGEGEPSHFSQLVCHWPQLEWLRLKICILQAEGMAGIFTSIIINGKYVIGAVA